MQVILPGHEYHGNAASGNAASGNALPMTVFSNIFLGNHRQ
jgi:hypothetical protein